MTRRQGHVAALLVRRAVRSAHQEMGHGYEAVLGLLGPVLRPLALKTYKFQGRQPSNPPLYVLIPRHRRRRAHHNISSYTSESSPTRYPHHSLTQMRPLLPVAQPCPSVRPMSDRAPCHTLDHILPRRTRGRLHSIIAPEEIKGENLTGNGKGRRSSNASQKLGGPLNPHQVCPLLAQGHDRGE